jgi:CRISPR-associated protein Cmr6
LIYHPTDTARLISAVHPENLHYLINFNQTNDHNATRSSDRLVNLKAAINPDQKTIEIIKKIHYLQRKSLCCIAETAEVAVLHGQLNGKLVHGLGMGHVRETAITLHNLYGVPYIPASSLKGALRNWFLQAFSQGKVNEATYLPEFADREDEKLLLGIYQDLFGTQEGRGRLIVFDCFCTEHFQLKPDIMTVHFKDYYDVKQQPPTDDHSLNPIAFYVLENTTFQFMMAIRNAQTQNTLSGLHSSQLMELAISWLQAMLKEQGIGSKTASGYGRFTGFVDVTRSTLDKAKDENAKIKEERKNREKERRIALEEANKAQLEQKRIAAMTPAQQLAYQISQFSDSMEDQQFSKDKQFFDQVIAFAEQGEVDPALELKKYWQRTGNWEKGSKKQMVKVKTIQSYL